MTKANKGLNQVRFVQPIENNMPSEMKIISWNCQMAFRKKWESILEKKPNLLVIQECEHPDKLKFGRLVPQPSCYVWYGDNMNKGIGVFSYDEKLDLQIDTKHDPAFRYVVPIRVRGRYNIYLFAVWAMPNSVKRSQRYIGQVWSALQYYQAMLEQDVIIIGDFNWNRIWDNEPNLTGNLTQLKVYLDNKGYSSAYHEIYNERFGEETKPTLYLQRKQEKPYHVDYCFYRMDRSNRIKSLKIGRYANWINLSDHMPITIEFE